MFIEPAVLDQHGADLGPTGIALYVAIVRLTLDGIPSFPFDRINELTGMDASAVSEALDRLVRRGLVTKTSQFNSRPGEVDEFWTLEDLPTS